MCCITSTQYLTTACVSALRPMSYNSHTSQHAEGSGHSIARFNTGKRVVIIHTILRFTQLNPLNGKLAVSSTSWKEIVEFKLHYAQCLRIRFISSGKKQSPLELCTSHDISAFARHSSQAAIALLDLSIRYSEVYPGYLSARG